jgi:hypothetical protein
MPEKGNISNINSDNNNEDIKIDNYMKIEPGVGQEPAGLPTMRKKKSSGAFSS